MLVGLVFDEIGCLLWCCVGKKRMSGFYIQYSVLGLIRILREKEPAASFLYQYLLQNLCRRSRLISCGFGTGCSLSFVD